VPLPAGTRVTALAAGGCFGLALTASGKVTQVAAGEEFGLVLTATGRVLAWGGNSSGEIGQPLPA
jgi:alpha-tubulin suppressor-like RCC1 family protein